MQIIPCKNRYQTVPENPRTCKQLYGASLEKEVPNSVRKKELARNMQPVLGWHRPVPTFESLADGNPNPCVYGDYSVQASSWRMLLPNNGIWEVVSDNP